MSMVAFVVLLLCAPLASAHKPASIGGSFPTFAEALRMEEIDVSQVAYAELTESARALWLVFEATAGTRFDVSLGVPALERLADYRPMVAVLGPGLPEIGLPIDGPPGTGGVLFDSAAYEPRFFHEPFTGTDSWILLDESVELPADGTYYVVAWPPGEMTGKLWVAIGRREQFSLRDILSLPAIVRDVRAFHEVPARSAGGTAGKILFLGLAAALIAWLAFGART
jgi:hypothetical protein